MKSITNFVFIAAVVALGAAFYSLNQKVNTLSSELATKTKMLAEITRDHESDLSDLKDLAIGLGEAAVSREHILQDSLEERIGTLEHEVEGFKYIFGTGHKKKAKR